MDEKFIEQIQYSLQEKSSIELNKILDEHDTNSWKEETFEAVRRILAERDMDETDQGEPRLVEKPKPADNRAKTGLIFAGVLLGLGIIFLLVGKNDLAGSGGYLAAIGAGFIIGGMVGFIGGLILLYGRKR